MKRLNPTTNEPFKRGAVREDGYVFFVYTKITKSDGFFKEIWLKPETSEKIKTKDRTHKKSKYQKKTDRHLPGFDGLTAAQKATVNMLKNLQAEIKQYGDITEDDIIESMIGYELDAGPLLEEAIRHAGTLSFNVKDLFRKSLSF